ncbi:MAG: phosphomannomutase/phosphoglucomutase [Proteobacteria bacterium]|nr:phosphomannomutase/phosphoglucomutase [Pseudomonadota bacterium]
MEGRRLDPTILREYDIRGIVGSTLAADDVTAIGRAFAAMIVRDGGETIAVGYDGRHSSPELEAALVDALAASGLKVFRIGLGPTPMLYYAAHTLGTDAGAMITGSHNPPDYNGVKMIQGGRSVFGERIGELGRMAAEGDFVSAAGSVAERPVAEEYVARLRQGFTGERPLFVAWDAGNGATGEVLQKLVSSLPGRHLLLNEVIDGDFPAHHPDPTVEENLEQLKCAVVGEGCDLGIAFDGDGDRIGVVDSKARVVWGDQLLAILAADVLAQVPGATIISDVKASQMVFDEIARLGGKPLMWKTGHSLIKDKMAETGAPLAGEMSGHIFFAHEYYGFDDALYAALRLLTIVSRTAGGLDRLHDALPVMVNTPEVRIPCPEERKFRVVDEVKARLETMDGITVNDIDGVRVQNGDGWWLLRASNTQGALVVRCESGSEQGLERLKRIVADQLQASGVEAPDFG